MFTFLDCLINSQKGTTESKTSTNFCLLNFLFFKMLDERELVRATPKTWTRTILNKSRTDLSWLAFKPQLKNPSLTAVHVLSILRFESFSASIYYWELTTEKNPKTFWRFWMPILSFGNARALWFWNQNKNQNNKQTQSKHSNFSWSNFQKLHDFTKFLQHPYERHIEEKAENNGETPFWRNFG